MHLSISYDKEADLLRITVSGQFDLGQYKGAMEQIVTSTEYAPTVTTIWDLTELEFSQVEKNLEKQVVLARKPYSQRKGAKIAYVVKSQLGFGLMRMLENLIGDEEAYQKVFYDYVEAEKWAKTGNDLHKTGPFG